MSAKRPKILSFILPKKEMFHGTSLAAHRTDFQKRLSPSPQATRPAQLSCWALLQGPRAATAEACGLLEARVPGACAPQPACPGPVPPRLRAQGLCPSDCVPGACAPQTVCPGPVPLRLCSQQEGPPPLVRRQCPPGREQPPAAASGGSPKAAG